MALLVPSKFLYKKRVEIRIPGPNDLRLRIPSSAILWSNFDGTNKVTLEAIDLPSSMIYSKCQVYFITKTNIFPILIYLKRKKDSEMRLVKTKVKGLSIRFKII